jgi:hypothetical protein
MIACWGAAEWNGDLLLAVAPSGVRRARTIRVTRSSGYLGLPMIGATQWVEIASARGRVI